VNLNMLAMLQIFGRPSAPILQLVTMYGGLIAVFYFILIRPQRQSQKKHQDLVEALKKGDEIMTAGGILGEVVFIKDDRVTIKSDNTRLVVARKKIEKVFTPEAATPAATESK
jgi:preprotein translocase subunit YajC